MPCPELDDFGQRFVATSSSDVITSILRQPDGKMIIAGSFLQVDGIGITRIVRLNTDGTVDDTFNPNVNSTINAVALQADGKIII